MKYGIYFDDDYNYLQHLRDVDTNNVEWVQVSKMSQVCFFYRGRVSEGKTPLGLLHLVFVYKISYLSEKLFYRNSSILYEIS